MVMFYCKRIMEGKMTLEQVPSRWRDEVEEKLKFLQPSEE